MSEARFYTQSANISCFDFCSFECQRCIVEVQAQIPNFFPLQTGYMDPTASELDLEITEQESQIEFEYFGNEYANKHLYFSIKF